MVILDWILIIKAAIIITIQTYRSAKDVDYVLFEMIALIVAASLSMRWHAQIASSLNLNVPLTLLFIFVISSIVFLIFGGIIARFAQFSLAPLDTWLGFIIGFISAWAILYVSLKVMLYFFPDGLSLNLPIFKKPIVIYDSIDNSPMAKEILNFNSFKAVTNFLNKLRTN